MRSVSVSPTPLSGPILSVGSAVAAMLMCRTGGRTTEHVMLMCDAWARPISAAVCDAEHMALVPEFATALEILAGSDVRMLVLGTMFSEAERSPMPIDIHEWPELVRMAAVAGVDLADRLLVGSQIVYSLADVTGIPCAWPPNVPESPGR